MVRACWYDEEARQTRALSLKTSNKEAAEALLADRLLAHHRTPKQPRQKLGRKNPWLSMARRMCKRAKENAKAKGRQYSLTPDFVADLMLRQGFKCAVTLMDLRLPKQARDPWAPSLDQIKPGQGYLPGNVRVVSMFVNAAMNQWGETPILELMRISAYRVNFDSEAPNVLADHRLIQALS